MRGLSPLPTIRQRAYEKWEAAGKPEGIAIRFWLEAEKELRERPDELEGGCSRKGDAAPR